MPEQTLVEILQGNIPGKVQGREFTAMNYTGFIGGLFGYRLLQWLGHSTAEGGGYCSGTAYRYGSKLETLFGAEIWREVRGKTVLDFGCGTGREAIEIAQHGARRVIGLDIRPKVLDMAAHDACRAGVDQHCVFTAHSNERADVAFSIDGFEHYGDPVAVLRILHGLLKPSGRLHVAFGPPWLHPFGGHLFSVFPWAHLIFTERALLRWRADFKSDGATRFHEVEGGLNQMTIRRFRRMVANSDFTVQAMELIPMRRLQWLFNPLTREFLTSIVHCVLIAGVPRAATA